MRKTARQPAGGEAARTLQRRLSTQLRPGYACHQEGWTFQGNHIVAVGLPASSSAGSKSRLFSRSAEALLPRMNAGAPTTNPAVFQSSRRG